MTYYGEKKDVCTSTIHLLRVVYKFQDSLVEEKRKQGEKYSKFRYNRESSTPTHWVSWWKEQMKYSKCHRNTSSAVPLCNGTQWCAWQIISGDLLGPVSADTQCLVSTAGIKLIPKPCCVESTPNRIHTSVSVNMPLCQWSRSKTPVNFWWVDNRTTQSLWSFPIFIILLYDSILF